MTYPSALVAAAFLALVFATGSANAEPSAKDRATELDAAAVVLATEKQDVRGALALYEEALALDATPERTCNVGMAHYQLDALPPAYLFLGQCLSHAGRLPAAKVAALSEAYAYVDRQLQAGAFAQVNFTATTGTATVLVSQLGRGAVFSTPRTVWLPFGEHSYQASADGYETSQGTVTVRKAGGATEQRVSIALNKDKIVAPSLPNVGSATGSSAQAPVTPVSKAKSSNRAAWVTLSAGAGLAIAGGVFHLRATGVRSDLEGVPHGDTRRSLVDDLKRERTIMGGFYGVGVVALGIGTFLMLSDGDSEAQESPVIGLQLGTSSIGLRGAF